MNWIAKSVLVVLGSVSAVGGVFIGKQFSSRETAKKTISEVLGKSLIDPKITSYSTKWDYRKDKLKKAKEGDLVPSLAGLKSKNDSLTGEDIRNWCEVNVKGFEGDDEGKKLKNAASYCTFNIKDKMTGTPIEENGSWDSAKQKLKGIQSGTSLSLKMKSVKALLEKNPNPQEDALKQWCLEAYDKQFMDDQDQDLRDANSYCV
ncbi:hypothetical protein HF1_07650 [Mycoplasma haemofelis str. Langford 1]|uniref:Uncharacterized protein n=1 Tax=Mycoplasma haemofelis (strain Langford 1) TaxID=941640 RepID=E8ZI02_MYCHL|nr:hypothetical protein [Mycoplasma haemofelis]CBY92773.1 hypothetical protein HF1_07650 [Mycoplasma haemofelis str. Langford 1]